MITLMIHGEGDLSQRMIVLASGDPEIDEILKLTDVITPDTSFEDSSELAKEVYSLRESVGTTYGLGLDGVQRAIELRRQRQLDKMAGTNNE